MFSLYKDYPHFRTRWGDLLIIISIRCNRVVHDYYLQDKITDEDTGHPTNNGLHLLEPLTDYSPEMESEEGTYQYSTYTVSEPPSSSDLHESLYDEYQDEGDEQQLDEKEEEEEQEEQKVEKGLEEEEDEETRARENWRNKTSGKVTV